MKKKSILFILAACASACFSKTITVTTVEDSYPVGPDGSLRAALAAADGGDTITFSDSLKGRTIAMVSVNAAGDDTSLVIDKPVTIDGNGVIIDGGWNGVAKSDAGGRIFLVPESVGKVTIRNLTMQNGHGRGWNNAGNRYFQGGAMCALSPVRFENCSFIRNGSGDQTAFAPTERGGGAIYAQADIELQSCTLLTNCIPCGSSSYGGAIYMAAGSLEARKCVFDANYSESFCGAVYAGPDAASVLFEDCNAGHSYCAGGNGVHGGFMWTKISKGEGKFVRFARCTFRDNYLRNSGGHGGVLYAEGTAPVTITDCEFADNRAHTGGSVRSHGQPTVYLNCTFTGGGMTGDTWGPAIDLRDLSYVINCTFGGNVFLNNQNSSGGSATASGGSVTYLNCVFAYNYRNVGDGVADAVKTNVDIGKFSGGWTLVNTIGNGKCADGATDVVYASSLDDVESASKLFADYRMVDTVKIYASDVKLKGEFVFPAFAADPKGKYRSRVFAPVKDGLLDGSGYPVKVNADYTHICYSPDGGRTWTDLYKNGAPDDSTLALVAADQRGVAYYRGRTPIGAATPDPVAGTMITIR